MIAGLLLTVAVGAPPAWVDEYRAARKEYGQFLAERNEEQIKELEEQTKMLRQKYSDRNERVARARAIKARIAELEAQARVYRRTGADRRFGFDEMLPGRMGLAFGEYELDNVYPNGDLRLTAHKTVYGGVNRNGNPTFNYRRTLGAVRLVGIDAAEWELRPGEIPPGVYAVRSKTADHVVLERVATEDEWIEHFPPAEDEPASRR